MGSPGQEIRRRILIVDDQEIDRGTLEAYLEPLDCDLEAVTNGRAALSAVRENPPDLVLLDVAMPDLDGFEVCRRLKANPQSRLIPVVMLTASDSIADRITALEAGAEDFLAKPVDRAELLARVRAGLRIKVLYDRLDETEQLVYGVAKAIEARFQRTAAQGESVASNARALGKCAGLGGDELENLYRAALLHNIGQIAVPEAILAKPGPLDPAEWEIMKRHPLIGESMARPLRSTSSVIAIIRHHHEWFDGAGYPDGLVGKAIPLGARIMAICDAYDALTSDRPHRPGSSGEEALDVLTADGGRQWDPSLVAMFVQVLSGKVGQRRGLVAFTSAVTIDHAGHLSDV
jgi:putative two-component system response regulator